MKVIVYHTGYGCDTGCCGHSIELINDNDLTLEDIDDISNGWFYGADKPVESDFSFIHFDGSSDERRKQAEEWIAEEFGDDHVKDLDWEHCIALDYSERGCSM